MQSIVVIAVNTFKEAIRNRVLYIILLFAILLMLASGVVSDLSISSPEDIIRSMGLAAMNFFSLLIAVFVGIGLVYNEIDKKTIYTIVSKPIDRTHFILGKFFGLLLTIYVNILIMSLFFFFTIYFNGYISDMLDNLSAHVRENNLERISQSMVYGYYIQSIFASIWKSILSILGLYSNEITQDLLKVILMNCFEIAIIVSFAILFSSFSTPTLSAMFTVMTFLVGRGNEDIIRYHWKLQDKINSGAVDFATHLKSWLAWLIAHISPNLSIFNRSGDALYSMDGVNIVFSEVLYGIAYPIGVVTIAVMIFNRRNFK